MTIEIQMPRLPARRKTSAGEPSLGGQVKCQNHSALSFVIVWDLDFIWYLGFVICHCPEEIQISKFKILNVLSIRILGFDIV
jgi:hypothetical protein